MINDYKYELAKDLLKLMNKDVNAVTTKKVIDYIEQVINDDY